MANTQKALEQILIDKQLLTTNELSELVQLGAVDASRNLADVLASSGKISSVDLLSALSEQYGVPGIDLSQVVIPVGNMHIVSEQFLREHNALPVIVNDERVFLAMTNPADEDTLQRVAAETGKPVFAYVVLRHTLTASFQALQEAEQRGSGYYIGPNVPQDYLDSIGFSSAESAARAMPQSRNSSSSRSFTQPIHRDTEVHTSSGSRSQSTSQAILTKPNKPNFVRVRAEGEPWHVLVAENDATIRRLLARMLTQKGYRVFEAETGTEALTLIQEELLDLLVLDTTLPEIHGMELCRWVKHSDTLSHLPVVMVSAEYRGWRIAADLRALGVAAFVEKPFQLAELTESVTKLLPDTDTDTDGDTHTAHTDISNAEADALVTTALAALEANDAIAAVHGLREAIACDATHFAAHFHLGLLLDGEEQPFASIQAFETAASLEPTHFATLRNLATLYQQLGFKHKAMEYWERCLATSPDADTRRSIKDHVISLL